MCVRANPYIYIYVCVYVCICMSISTFNIPQFFYRLQWADCWSP